jgi:cold shock CspA family protein
MSESLFKVSNHHTPACGQPPSVDADAPAKYCGYFANEHGEQAVYVHDSETDEATVRMGDAGWENEYSVVNGCIEGVKVTEAEATWIRACWLATRALKERHAD